jgi:hypothetical protein
MAGILSPKFLQISFKEQEGEKVKGRGQGAEVRGQGIGRKKKKVSLPNNPVKTGFPPHGTDGQVRSATTGG